MTYNVQWLLDEIARLLDFDSTATNQAYHGGSADPWWRVRAGLNRAYTKVVNDAKLECPHDYFKGVYRCTWPSGDVTYTLPEQVYNSNMLTIFDVTNSEYGIELVVSDRSRDGGVHWDDYRTLRWSTAGPSQDTNLKFEYLMDAETLTHDAQVPLLVPYRHRHMLVWGGAIECRVELDEDTVPQSWANQAEAGRVGYIMDLSKGRLQTGNRSRIYDDYEY